MKRVCSEDFRRRVWMQADSIPSIETNIVNQITQQLSGYRIERSEALVDLGPSSQNARVHLTLEDGLYRVHDAVMPGPTGQPLAMKQAMRMQLAYGSSTSKEISLASGWNEMPPKQTIQQTANKSEPKLFSSVPVQQEPGESGMIDQNVFHAVYENRDSAFDDVGSMDDPQAFKRSRVPGYAQPMPVEEEPLLQPVPMNFK